MSTEDAPDLRERLIAVETTLGHLSRDLEALRADLHREQDARLQMLQEREPYKKLIWGVIGAFGLFVILERMKLFEKLLK